MRIFPDIDPVLLEAAFSMARTMPQEAFNGWLLALASHNAQLTTTLLTEIRRMATNDEQLTEAVQDLLDAYQTNTTALEAEVAAMRAKGLDGADPVITAAVSNIENIVAKMKQSTSDAQAAMPTTISAAAGAADTTSTPAAGNSSSPAGSGSTGDAELTGAGSTG